MVGSGTPSGREKGEEIIIGLLPFSHSLTTHQCLSWANCSRQVIHEGTWDTWVLRYPLRHGAGKGGQGNGSRKQACGKHTVLSIYWRCLGLHFPFLSTVLREKWAIHIFMIKQNDWKCRTVPSVLKEKKYSILEEKSTCIKSSYWCVMWNSKVCDIISYFISCSSLRLYSSGILLPRMRTQTHITPFLLILSLPRILHLL